MKKILFLILYFIFLSNIVSGDSVSITESSIWNDSDASSWTPANGNHYSPPYFDSSFTADLPQRVTDSIDYPDGDYYWLHIQMTFTYTITTPRIIMFGFLRSADTEPPFLGWYWQLREDMVITSSGSQTIGLRVRYDAATFDNTQTCFRADVRLLDLEYNDLWIKDWDQLGAVYLQPLPDPTSTPTPANTPTGTQTPTVTPTPTHDGTVIFNIYNHLNNEDPMTVVLGDNFPAYNWVERRTYPEDYPDEDAPFAHHFYVTRENMDYTYTTLRTYPTTENSLKPGQIKYFPDGGESWLPSAGIDISVECRGYYLNSRAWALAAGNTSTDAVEINFVTPTPTNTPTNTPTPTKTPTPTPFCWIEYCPSDGVVKRIPLVEEEWKVAGKEYAAECIVNGITVSAPVINGASSSAAMEVYTDALHYFEEW